MNGVKRPLTSGASWRWSWVFRASPSLKGCRGNEDLYLESG